MRRASRIRTTIIALLALLPVMTAGCSGATGDQTTISISGAFALYPMVVEWTEQYAATHPDVQFDVQGGGAGKGMSDMLAGAADIAMLSREAKQEELDQGAFPVAVTKDAVVATVNANNPVFEALMAKGITPDVVGRIWITGEVTTWGQVVGTDDPTPINVYTRSDSAGAAEVWAKYIGGEAQEDLKGTGVNGDPGLAEAVRQDANAIGFNNVGFAYDLTTSRPVDGIAVIPIDTNEDGTISADESFYSDRDGIVAAITDGRYPSPPARVLYLVTKGPPSPEIADFYRWVLSEGQQYVDEAGYVTLPDALIQESLSAVGP